MSDFAKDYDEFICTVCKKTYYATTDRQYCDKCTRIIYMSRFKQNHSLFGERKKNNE